MKRLKTLTVVSLIFVISGCAQVSHLTVTGPESYQLTKRSRIAIGDGSDLLEDLYVEANQYCEKLGKKMIPVDSRKQRAIPGSDFASALLKFGCR